jgi:NTP pyrophosphatase (non-canonical NTP hydrolase)
MKVIDQIRAEVVRATMKFPTWPSDPLHALAVLGEEYGELTKAMLQLTYEPHKTSAAEVREEAIQTAAMALRLAMSLDRYEYQQSPQHEQDSSDSESEYLDIPAFLRRGND